MSQRLMDNTKFPFFLNSFGERVFELRGFSPDGDGDDQDPPAGSEGTDPPAGTGSGSEGQDADKSTETDAAAEAAAFKARMQQADRRAAAAEAKIKEYEDAKLSNEEKATKELTELREAKTVLETELSELRLQNAFLASNDIKWHNPELALKSADLSEVRNEDGTIDKKALAKALKKVAEESPFLVKKDEQGQQQQHGPSGGNVGGKNGSNSNPKADEESLRRKYPALFA